MPGICKNSPAENAIFMLQISFKIEQWNLQNRLHTLHVTDGLFWALGVPRQFATCEKLNFHSQAVKQRELFGMLSSYTHQYIIDKYLFT